SAAKIPYDGYGVGTKMGVSADAPWFDIAYKLVEFGGRPVLKLSTGKASWPEKKQIFRRHNNQGYLSKDLIGLRNENLPGAEPLLQKVMEKGALLAAPPSLESIRAIFRQEFERLPNSIKAIRNATPYPVEFTPRLQESRQQIVQSISRSKS